MKKYTEKEWLAEGEKRFGPKRQNWKFVCPKCKTAQSAVDFVHHAEDKENVKDRIKNGVIGYSCIGRFVENIGCDWTLGGPTQIHNTVVLESSTRIWHPVFEFAPAPADDTLPCGHKLSQHVRMEEAKALAEKEAGPTHKTVCELIDIAEDSAHVDK